MKIYFENRFSQIIYTDCLISVIYAHFYLRTTSYVLFYCFYARVLDLFPEELFRKIIFFWIVYYKNFRCLRARGKIIFKKVFYLTKKISCTLKFQYIFWNQIIQKSRINRINLWLYIKHYIPQLTHKYNICAFFPYYKLIFYIQLQCNIFSFISVRNDYFIRVIIFWSIVYSKNPTLLWSRHHIIFLKSRCFWNLTNKIICTLKY